MRERGTRGHRWPFHIQWHTTRNPHRYGPTGVEFTRTCTLYTVVVSWWLARMAPHAFQSRSSISKVVVRRTIIAAIIANTAVRLPARAEVHRQLLLPTCVFLIFHLLAPSV